MDDEVRIEAVGRRGKARAIRFLAAGARDDWTARRQADAMREVLRRRDASAVSLWWARRKRATLASAMVVESPGRIGMLFCCPPEAPGVDRAWLVRLVRAISLDAVGRGISVVQALVTPDDRAQSQVLLEAGLRQLAELLYLRRNLSAPAPAAQPQSQAAGGELLWRNALQFDETELGEVVAATYTDSLDCPLLRGVRRMPDVIHGHKQAGAFRPEAWWIVSRGRAAPAAGCILVNDSPTTRSAEVVYVGVTPEYRGQGIASAMLRRAMEQARGRGRDALSVAVDSRNAYALKVYRELGFAETRRRLAYVMLARGREPHQR